jgi:hypothetical protein
MLFSAELMTFGAPQTSSTKQSQDSKNKCDGLTGHELHECVYAMKPWPAPKDKTQQSPVPNGGAAHNTSPGDEKEAQFHYKVALTALKNKDFDVAVRELLIAARLAPKNALVQYNLAVVKSQSGNPTEALTYLKQAIELGTLPDEQAKDAERRLVDLTYASERFSWLIGSWKASFTARVSLSTPAGYADCTYEGPGEFKMNVSKADDQSDALTGEILFSAESEKFIDGPTSYCRKTYGKEDQIGSATYEIGSVTEIGKGIATIQGIRINSHGEIGVAPGEQGTGANLTRAFTRISFNVLRHQDRLALGANDCDCIPSMLERD